MAAVLRRRGRSWRELDAYAPRRDEIGAFAQALIHHFQLVQRQQELASQQQARTVRTAVAAGKLPPAKACRFRSASRRSCSAWKVTPAACRTASGNLVSISSEADARAAASAQSTQRVSGHVDVVASSIRDIAATLTEVVGEAERTSEVAAAARSLVAAAKNDVARADRSGAHHRAGHRADRGRRQSDQSAGAERHHRGRARGRDGARLRRRRP